MQFIRSGTGRPQRTVAGLAAAVLTFALVGCDGSDSGGGSKPSPASTSVDAKALAARMTDALAAAGGGTMQISSANGSATGALSFGPVNSSKMISEIWTSGTYTSPDKLRTSYILHTGPKPDDEEIYINDGTPLKGRPWAEVPHFAAQMKDATTVLKAHPNYGIIPDLVPGLQPHVLPSLLAAQTGLVRASDPETVNGVEATHYLGSFDGSVPTAGSAATFDLYIDKDGRPARFLAYVNEDPVTTTYGGWGKQPAVKAPSAADTTVVPATAS